MFDTGKVVLTQGISNKMTDSNRFYTQVIKALERYKKEDWGEICEEDKMSNDMAVKYGDRILASYETINGKIWIITEWDRSYTTILFPEEY